MSSEFEKDMAGLWALHKANQAVEELKKANKIADRQRRDALRNTREQNLIAQEQLELTEYEMEQRERRHQQDQERHERHADKLQAELTELKIMMLLTPEERAERVRRQNLEKEEQLECERKQAQDLAEKAQLEAAEKERIKTKKIGEVKNKVQLLHDLKNVCRAKGCPEAVILFDPSRGSDYNNADNLVSILRSTDSDNERFLSEIRQTGSKRLKRSVLTLFILILISLLICKLNVMLGAIFFSISCVWMLKLLDNYACLRKDQSYSRTKRLTDIKNWNTQKVEYEKVFDDLISSLDLKVIEVELEAIEAEYEDVCEYYDDAVALVAEKRQASISMIQRKLRIGYNEAARIIERMEKEGLVGPSDGTSKTREVLIDLI